MAIDYFLLIDDEDQRISPRGVHDLLMASFSLKTNSAHDILLAEGVDVYIAEEEFDRAKRKGRSHPGISILFEINKFEKFDVGIVEMLRMVDLVLRQFGGDAELSFQMDDIVLSKAGGQVIFADDQEFWTDERKAIFSGA